MPEPLKSLDQRVYDSIKSMIIHNEIAPGEIIDLDLIGDKLSTNKNELFSALRLLEQRHLLLPVTGKGYKVRQVTREEMIDLFELREALDGLAARRVTKIATPENIARLRTFFQHLDPHDESQYEQYSLEDRRFHEFIVEMAQIPVLSSIHASFNFLTVCYQRGKFSGLIRRPDETDGEHKAIIDAICTQNAPLAEELMRHHFRASAIRLMTQATD